MTQVLRAPTGLVGSGSFADLGPAGFVAVPGGMVRSCIVRAVVGSGTADATADVQIVDTNAVVTTFPVKRAYPVEYGTKDGAPDLEILNMPAGFKIQAKGANVTFSILNCWDDDATA